MAQVLAPGRAAPASRIALGALAIALGVAADTLAGQGPLARNLFAALAAWVASLALAAAACAPSPRTAENRRAAPGTGAPADRRPGDPREWALLAALFAGALAVRAWQNAGIPALWSGDEGGAGLFAARIVHGEPINPFGVGWFSFPALFSVIPAGAIALLGQTYEALRWPSALAGALAVVGLYWWIRSAYGRTAGLASALMLASSHHAIHWSRIGLNNAWDGVFMVLVGGLLCRGWQTSSRWAYMWSGVLVGLSQYFYVGSRSLPFVVLCWLAGALLVDRARLRNQRAHLASLALMAVVTALPLGVFFARNPQHFHAPTSRVSLLKPDYPEPGGNWFQHTARLTGRPVLVVAAHNLRDAALGYVWVPLRGWTDDSGRPLLLSIPSVFAVAGLGWMLARPRDPNARYLLVVLASTIAVAAITESTPAGQRYVGGAPAAAAAVGLGFAAAVRQLTRLPGRARRTGVGIAVLALSTGYASELRFYFVDYAPRAGLHDRNTLVATAVARHVKGHPSGARLYFLGAPRMTYHGFATMQFVAPHVDATDILEPLGTPLAGMGRAPLTTFAFTPERAAEVELVRRWFPGGREQWRVTPDGRRLVLLYDVAGS
jgi:hypothetical protein